MSDDTNSKRILSDRGYLFSAIGGGFLVGFLVGGVEVLPLLVPIMLGGLAWGLAELRSR